jgi:hypothetical protein
MNISSCNRDWTRQFIKSVFTATFINGKLKKHQEQLLFDNERALLPATQPIVERAIKIEETEVKLRKAVDKIFEYTRERNEIQAELYRLRNRETPVERAEFVRACPDQECRGFLSTQWKCGICQKWACPQCHEIKGLDRDIEHTCNPDTLATARLLANDTKPCPNCRTGIFKIDGCDQMWCTQCHTAFSWKTGNIEKVIHNPHYYEYLRRTRGEVPRNPLDMVCGQNIMDGRFNHQIQTAMTQKKCDKTNDILFKETTQKIRFIERNALHYRYVIIERIQEFDYERKNRQLRIYYLRKLLTQDELKIALQREEKKTLKNAETREVFQMLITTAEDIMNRFYHYIIALPTESHWDNSIINEMDYMLNYANECIGDICQTYGCTMRKLNTQLDNYMGQV